MDLHVSLTAWIAAALAAAAAALLVPAVHTPHERRESFGAGLVLLAVGVYSGGLLARLAERSGQLAIPGDLFGMSGLALALAGLYLGQFRRQAALWGVVAAVTALFFGAAAALPGTPLYIGAARSSVLKLHVAFVLLAALILAMLGAVALLYVVKERALRSDPTGWGRRLPNLERMDRLMHRALQIGFLLLTIGVVFGAVLYVGAAERNVRSDFLGLATLVVWMLLAIALSLRELRGWGGHQQAVLLGVLAAALLFIVALAFGVGPLLHRGAA